MKKIDTAQWYYNGAQKPWSKDQKIWKPYSKTDNRILEEGFQVKRRKQLLETILSTMKK